MEDREVKEYCEEVANAFVEEYGKVLEDTIFKMMAHFGYKREMNSADWLMDNNFDLLMDENYIANEDKKEKTIFLLDRKQNDVVSLFMVTIIGGMEYSISDVFVRDNGDF